MERGCSHVAQSVMANGSNGSNGSNGCMGGMMMAVGSMGGMMMGSWGWGS